MEVATVAVDERLRGELLLGRPGRLADPRQLGLRVRVAAGARLGGREVALSALALELQTITIPATVIGHEAELIRPRLDLTAPVELAATWSGDDDATVDATLALGLSWSLTVDGVGLPLGAPSLPPLPVKLTLSGDGLRVTAELRVHAPGELWNWADLIKLSDLELVLGAGTPAS